MTAWMNGLVGRLGDLWAEERGQGLVEYALILALIAVVALVALTVLGGDVTSELTTIGSSVPG